MPRVVACNHCQQRFLAEDFLLGTVVPCPSCGTSLAIPAAAPVAPAAPFRPLAGKQAAPPAMSTGWALMDRLPADPRGRQRAIALAVVATGCLLWVLLAMPSLVQLVLGRPVALEKAGAGAVIFWVGVLAACGGILEWSLFMNSYKMRGLQDWFGYEGARWFYVCIGGCVALLGLGLTFTTSGVMFHFTQRTSPDRPVFAVRQERPGPLIAQPAPPPPPPAPGSAPPAPPAPPLAAGQGSRAGEQLPGHWRELDGGFCIKIPAAVEVIGDGTHSKDAANRTGGGNPAGRTREQNITGRDKGGNQSVYFTVNVNYEPVERLADEAFLRRFQHEQAQRGEGELVRVNGLTVLKQETHKMQPGALNGKMVTLHGTTYHYVEKHRTIRISVYSQLPLDAPAQKALRPYMDTFQRSPLDLAAALSQPRGPLPGQPLNDPWKPLEGGFRIQLAPGAEIETDSISRGTFAHTAHHLVCRLDEGARLDITVLTNPKWNHRNEARATVAEVGRRGFAQGREYVAVELSGLVMEKITIGDPDSGRRDTKVEYKYLEGQHQITMQVWAELPLDHPSFQAAIRSAESIEKTPAN